MFVKGVRTDESSPRPYRSLFGGQTSIYEIVGVARVLLNELTRAVSLITWRSARYTHTMLIQISVDMFFEASGLTTNKNSAKFENVVTNSFYRASTVKRTIFIIIIDRQNKLNKKQK